MFRLVRVLAAFAFGVMAAFVCLQSGPELAAQPKPAPPAVPKDYPTLTTPMNLGGKPGTAVDVLLTGTNLTEATGIWTSFGGTATIPEGQKDAAKLKAKIDIPSDTPAGLHFYRVATKVGVSNPRSFCVDDLPAVEETDKNKAKATPQPVTLPCVVLGKAEPEASDFFKFPVEAGTAITIEVIGRRLGSPIDPVILLYDGTGREMAGVYADDTPGLQSDARVRFTPKQSGELIVEVRDTTYRGGADYVYRLRIGGFPGATTAFPLAIERGKTVPVGFSGPGLEGVKPVSVTAAKDPAVRVVYAAPGRGEAAGWPVPVRISDMPEGVEAEPNDDAKKATKLPVPGGVSARFGQKNDLDHFVFPGKKGTKYVLTALTHEVNAPTEVLFRVLDAKGAELAKSNPQQATARAEFTPATDGEFTIACEHLNYLSGPNEVYHLSVAEAVPDFVVSIGLDRIDVPVGGVGLLPVTGIAKLNGFAAPVELTVISGLLMGSLTVPAGANPQPATPLYVPVRVKVGGFSAPGPNSFVLKATAKVGDREVVRYGSVLDQAKAAMSGLPYPPVELTTQLAAAVVPAPPFTFAVSPVKPEVKQGGTVKLKVTIERGKKFEEEIAIAASSAPANVTLKGKPVAKGSKEGELELSAAANAAAGPGVLILRGTAKVGGKDVTVTAMPVTITVAAVKKEEKKEKDKKAKKEEKKE